jgi:hypothetical protein
MASEPLSSSWPSSWHRGLPEHALQARGTVALPGCSMGFGGVVGPCAPWWQRTSALSRRCTSAIFSADIGPAQITRLRRTQ